MSPHELNANLFVLLQNPQGSLYPPFAPGMPNTAEHVLRCLYGARARPRGLSKQSRVELAAWGGAEGGESLSRCP
jgi:hypothetical protein